MEPLILSAALPKEGRVRSTRVTCFSGFYPLGQQFQLLLAPPTQPPSPGDGGRCGRAGRVCEGGGQPDTDRPTCAGGGHRIRARPIAHRVRRVAWVGREPERPVESAGIPDFVPDVLVIDLLYTNNMIV